MISLLFLLFECSIFFGRLLSLENCVISLFVNFCCWFCFVVEWFWYGELIIFFIFWCLVVWVILFVVVMLIIGDGFDFFVLLIRVIYDLVLDFLCCFFVWYVGWIILVIELFFVVFLRLMYIDELNLDNCLTFFLLFWLILVLGIIENILNFVFIVDEWRCLLRFDIMRCFFKDCIVKVLVLVVLLSLL